MRKPQLPDGERRDRRMTIWLETELYEAIMWYAAEHATSGSTLARTALLAYTGIDPREPIADNTREK